MCFATVDALVLPVVDHIVSEIVEPRTRGEPRVARDVVSEKVVVVGAAVVTPDPSKLVGFRTPLGDHAPLDGHGLPVVDRHDLVRAPAG